MLFFSQHKMYVIFKRKIIFIQSHSSQLINVGTYEKNKKFQSYLSN